MTPKQSTPILKMRCGNCVNCKLVESKKKLFLAQCGTRHKSGRLIHADDSTIKVWNDLLRDYPCIGVK